MASVYVVIAYWADEWWIRGIFDSKSAADDCAASPDPKRLATDCEVEKWELNKADCPPPGMSGD